MTLVRTAAREKFDSSLSGMRVSPDVGKQMGDAIQVCWKPVSRTFFNSLVATRGCRDRLAMRGVVRGL